MKKLLRPTYISGKLDPNYRRRQLLEVCLVIGVIALLLLAILNLFLFDALDLATLDAVGASIAASLWYLLKKRHLIELVSWLFTLMIGLLITTFLSLAAGNNNGYLWTALFPPFAFFLLGKNKGLWVTVVFFSIFTLQLYDTIFVQQAPHLTLGAFLNTIEVFVISILLYRFYEKTRTEANQLLHEQSIRLDKMAKTDKLTQLFNRQYLDSTLFSLYKERRSLPISILLLDVDLFKRINDEYGHLFGDEVLIKLAQRLSESVRGYDVVGRWGGEEFLIIAPNTSHLDAVELAERIRKRLNIKVNDAVTTSVSIGVSSTDRVKSPEELISQADRALYQAKSNGRNRVQSFVSAVESESRKVNNTV
ncbi:diguanylate cyclase (GGDEF)-like protein [Idiomarina fontislapidosi]|uniref:diguanylate cyclase n=1 Tax=Idiomarina fontislapidosi TaxID=263723 RepID=A0A432Y9A6_9GAMM|nr:GGDEF domain-containing protein [Idiomarina fontislapidosi]PYE34506.1 diguanylate cyclase (GGDEF)-like protein [Idiomarina fontislapidosi]RUO57537.1 hypothetical protein CWE25_03475 [Idiomarina fontislapidosi]